MIAKSYQEMKWLFVTTTACFFLTMGTMGVYRGSSGVLFLELMSVYSISREQASWPISLSAAVSSFSGILAGLLLQYFSIRQVSMLSALSCSFGMLVFFLAPSMVVLTIGYGIFFGFGAGAALVSTNLFMNREIHHHRATVNGISKSGASLGVIVMPFITEQLLNQYSVPGTILLLGAFSLQCLVFSCYICPFKVKGHTQHVDGNGKKDNESDKTGTFEGSSVILSVPVISKMEYTNSQENCADFYTKCAQLEIKDQNPSVNMARGFSSVLPFKPSSVLEAKVVLEKTQLHISPVIFTNTSLLGRCKEVLFKRIFYLISMSYVTYLFVPNTVMVVIVDFGVGIGMSKNQALVLLPIMAVGELLGRSGLGWISDRRILTRKAFVTICDLSTSTCLFLLSIIPIPGLVFTLIFFLGLISGSAFAQIHVLYGDYFRKEVMSIALGLGQTWNIIIFLARPAIIGYFRDKVGSYSLLFVAMAGLTLVSALVWILDSKIPKYTCTRSPRVNKKNSQRNDINLQ